MYHLLRRSFENTPITCTETHDFLTCEKVHKSDIDSLIMDLDLELREKKFYYELLNEETHKLALAHHLKYVRKIK